MPAASRMKAEKVNKAGAAPMKAKNAKKAKKKAKTRRVKTRRFSFKQLYDGLLQGMRYKDLAPEQVMRELAHELACIQWTNYN